MFVYIHIRNYVVEIKSCFFALFFVLLVIFTYFKFIDYDIQCTYICMHFHILVSIHILVIPKFTYESIYLQTYNIYTYKYI